jgi:phytoene dehydrogenase-like protein
MSPLVARADDLLTDLLGPLPLPPRHPLALMRFGMNAWRSARGLAQGTFKGERARALFAGMAAHAMLPLENVATAAFGLVLGVTAHAVGWPLPRGGAQSITNALAAHLRSLGGEIVTGRRIAALDELPQHRLALFDVTPRQLLRIAGDRLPSGYRRSLERYRYGPGVFKVDWALNGPVPWTAQDCQRAATVHLGGTLAEIAASERAVWQGAISERPYVLVVQHSPFDGSRAPAGKATLWAYCHVPNGSTVDMTERIEQQIERFAPGFRQRILARSVMPPAALEEHNANYIGGDINGGVQDLAQLYTRPAARIVPYSTPNDRIFICSSSTPPGGGVHGMCGYFAARAALRKLS